nr:histidine phosphatase family protein [Actinomyces bouchesdurhonensis]
MKIVLVRHGQTPANRLGALDTVRPGLGLTVEGMVQASRLAQRWEVEVAAPPTLIALSGLHRTRLTAAPLAARYGLTPLVCPGIRELRSGQEDRGAADRGVPTATALVLTFDGTWEDLAPGTCAMRVFYTPTTR